MSWCGNQNERDACMDTCSPGLLDPSIWQELPPLLIALIISKLPIVKLIKVVQQCGRFIKQQVTDDPPELLRIHRSAECLFPIFIVPGRTWRSTFDVRIQNWSPLPELNLLPSNVQHVLTGGGGLMCVTSSQNQQYRPETMTEEDRMRFPSQPIVVICNPLTRETRILLPIPGALKFPVAHMKTSACTGNYAMYLAGWNEQTDEMVVTVYASKAQAWMGWRSLPNGLRPAKTTSPGEASSAVIGNEMWLAGELRWAGVWEPRILCFDFCTQNWKSVLHWLPNCESPRMVETDTCLYAVTRLSEKPYSLQIFEIIGACEKTCPCSNFEEIAQMPHDVYCRFLELDVRQSHPRHVKWECRAGKGFIFFHNVLSGRIAWYHVRAAMRSREKCWGIPGGQAPKFECSYISLVNCMWQPSFATSISDLVTEPIAAKIKCVPGRTPQVI